MSHNQRNTYATRRFALTREVINAYEDAKMRGLCLDAALDVASDHLCHTLATTATDSEDASRTHGLRLAVEHQFALATRLISRLPAEDATRQPHAAINHPAWTLGHLCHYHPAALCLIQGQSVADPACQPEADLFDAGSIPVAEVSAYPAWAELLTRYRQGHKRIREALASMSVDVLAQPPGLPRWMKSFGTTENALLYLLVHHEAIHTGQLLAWCRAADHGERLTT